MSEFQDILDDISTNDDWCERYTKSEIENIVVAEEIANDMAKQIWLKI